MIWIAVPWCLSALLGALLIVTMLDLQGAKARHKRAVRAALEILGVLIVEADHHD